MKAKKPIDYLSTIDKSIFIKSLTNLHFSHIILRSTILHTRISLSKLNQIHLSVSVYFLVYQELSQRSLLWAVRSKRSSSPASFLVVEGRGISVSTRQSSRVSGGGGRRWLVFLIGRWETRSWLEGRPRTKAVDIAS